LYKLFLKMRNKIKGEIVTYMIAIKKIKILGGKNLPPLWVRFNRLQSTKEKSRKKDD